MHNLVLTLSFTDGLAHQHGGGGAQAEAEYKKQSVEVTHNGVGGQHFHGIIRIT